MPGSHWQLLGKEREFHNLGLQDVIYKLVRLLHPGQQLSAPGPPFSTVREVAHEGIYRSDAQIISKDYRT